MAIYRLKSKLYGELDNLSSSSSNNQKNGLTMGKALMIGATALGTYKMAGAGKFGVGAQNAVNRFRVATSSAGSARSIKGLTGLNANETAAINRINDAKAAGTLTATTAEQQINAVKQQYNAYRTPNTPPTTTTP